MARKTEESKAEGGCLGAQCGDGTCVACQVGMAQRHHSESVSAARDVAAAVRELVAAVRGQAAPSSPPAPSAPTTVAAGQQTAEVAAAPAAPAQKLTIESVRPAVLEWIKANGRDPFIAILQKFGAQRLPDVKEADLPRLLQELGPKK